MSTPTKLKALTAVTWHHKANYPECEQIKTVIKSRIVTITYQQPDGTAFQVDITYR